MTDLSNIISKVEIVTELVENKDVKLLAGLLLEYLKEEDKARKPGLGFESDKEDK